jgi:hypothetical protein
MHSSAGFFTSFLQHEEDSLPLILLINKYEQMHLNFMSSMGFGFCRKAVLSAQNNPDLPIENNLAYLCFEDPGYMGLQYYPGGQGKSQVTF